MFLKELSETIWIRRKEKKYNLKQIGNIGIKRFISNMKSNHASKSK